LAVGCWLLPVDSELGGRSYPLKACPTSYSSVASVTSVISELREDEALARGRRAPSHGFLRVSVVKCLANEFQTRLARALRGDRADS